jgi:hypothetical protein
MADGVNQQPGLFQRIGNFFGAGDPSEGQRIGTPFFPGDPNAASPTDPFAGLSRPQRTMLGFAALRDAASALEGRDTNFFAESLGGFEEARERERLRAQGEMQNRVGALQALATLNEQMRFNQAFGLPTDPATDALRNALMQAAGLSSGAAPMAGGAPSVVAPAQGGTRLPQGEVFDPTTGQTIPYTGEPEGPQPAPATPAAPAPASQGQDFEAQRQAIFEQMRNRIAAGAGVADLQAQLDDINRREVEASSAQATETEEEETREMRIERGRQVVMPRIDAALSFLITGYDDAGQPILNPALTTVGGLRALEATNPAAYRQYVNALQTLGSDVLIETLNRATFGSLSEQEMRVAMGFEGSLDPADPYGTLQTLLQMRRNFENLFGSDLPQGQGTNLPSVSWD